MNYGTNWFSVLKRMFWSLLTFACWSAVIWAFLWLGIRNWRP